MEDRQPVGPAGDGADFLLDWMRHRLLTASKVKALSRCNLAVKDADDYKTASAPTGVPGARRAGCRLLPIIIAFQPSFGEAIR